MSRAHRTPLVLLGFALACGSSGSGTGGSSDAGEGSSSEGGEGSGTAGTTAGTTASSSTTASTTASSTVGTDATDEGGSSSDTGSVPEGVPVFVAQGMVGRSTISCDDGLTWVGDRSWDLEGDVHLCGSTTPVDCSANDGATCSQVWYDGSCSMDACDCGHSPGFSKGVAYGNGVFVATWGWGWPGAVSWSTNGIDWTVGLDNDSFGGLRFDGNRFVVASRTPQVSSDGATWMPTTEADFEGTEGVIWSVRRFGWGSYGGEGRFVAYASGNSSADVLVSSDAGDTWWRPSSFPADCVGEGPGAYGDIIGGNDVLLMADGDGHACRSVDGGQSWESHIITDSRIASSGIWTGEEFWFWGWGNRYRSSDGITWTTEAIASDEDVGPVARSPEGTLVAVNNVWLGYDEQRFLRSTDGMSWDVLPSGAFTPGHPIFFITHGYAEPSELCPG
ncbi:MAG: hypothetical protein U0168_17565 [Nannocystaceae bacterium]|jgi:hypothetical protein